MQISNNQIIFDASDLEKFSVELRADIAFRAGDAIPHEYLSARVNAILQEAAYVHNNDLVLKAKDVCVAFAKADKTIQDAIKTTLGVAVDADPLPTPITAEIKI